VDYTLSYVLPGGYIGPAFIRDGKERDPRVDNFRWPNTVFFRALAAKAEATNDPRIAEAIRQHYLSDHAPYGGPSRDVTNIEGMLWSCERTRDQRLLQLAEKAWADFLKSAEPGDRESGDLHPERVFANTRIHAHGVTYIEKAKLPAILYMHTGNPEHLRFALAAQERIFSHHMLIDGIPSTTEDYRETTALDAHETCNISDHTWTWGYLMMATGDGIWGDRIERACFNAGLGAVKKDWRAVQYFSCPNQFLATQTSTMLRCVREGPKGGCPIVLTLAMESHAAGATCIAFCPTTSFACG
jgi:rhamnogalacturonyl hydrolase YesR